MNFFIQFFICGILTSFLFPPFFLTPLGLIIFPYLFYLINNKEFKSFSYVNHFFAGFIYGLGFFLIYLIWIKEPFLVDKSTENIFFLSYALIIYCSLFYGIVFFCLRYVDRMDVKLLIFPSLFVGVEYICANLSFGFPWFSFSLVHSANSLGSTIIFYLGTYGLSYFTILFFLFPIIFLYKNNISFKTYFIIYLFFLISFSLLIIFRFFEINKSYLYNDNLVDISLVQLN